MTDAAFDQLVEELRAVAPHAPELLVPGGGRALLSLDNRPVEEWWPGCPVVVQPKVDGASVALRYVGGVLAAAWTRSGIDCTEVLRDVVPNAVSSSASTRLVNVAAVHMSVRSTALIVKTGLER